MSIEDGRNPIEEANKFADQIRTADLAGQYKAAAKKLGETPRVMLKPDHASVDQNVDSGDNTEKELLQMDFYQREALRKRLAEQINDITAKQENGTITTEEATKKRAEIEKIERIIDKLNT